jgi:glycosyltransferase involved in cell wall biosynthesis
MGDEPSVSVLMTAFNREKYIAEAIDSVLASTFKDWELIIVDDQSKDSTVEIAQTYASSDPRIKVYVNPYNLGDYPNRNKAASYAKGKYLKYVDADDKIYPHGLEVLVTMMELAPEAGYGLCTIPADKNHIFPLVLLPSEAYRYHYLQQKGIFLRAPLSSIIRKEAFERVGGFVNKKMVGDYEMWHKLSLRFAVVLLPQGLVWYRVHSEQEMASHSKYAMEYLTISEHYVDQSELSHKEKALLLNKLRRNQFMKLIKNPMKMELKKRIEFFKQSNIELKKILSDTSYF